MSTLFRAAILPVVLFLACVSAPLRAEEEKRPVLPGADGKDHAPLTVSAGKKGTVIFFVSAYCPTSNTFAPEMTRIAGEYGGAFDVYFVHSDKSLNPADVLRHTELNAIKSPVLMDAEQTLAKRLGAKVTPEAVVVGPDGKTLYQGRVNDLYLTPTRRQRQATTKDLRDALDAVKQGKPAPVAKTEAVGCKIDGVP